MLTLALIFSVLIVRHFWYEVLQENGIERLEWQGLDLSFHGFSVSELTLHQVRPMRDVTLQFRELAFVWRWPELGKEWLPQATVLTVGYLNLDWQAKSWEEPAVVSPILNDWPSEVPLWLPSHVAIQKFEMILPCETGRCPLDGALSITGFAVNPRFSA
jgi:hypothetical protein